MFNMKAELTSHARQRGARLVPADCSQFSCCHTLQNPEVKHDRKLYDEQQSGYDRPRPSNHGVTPLRKIEVPTPRPAYIREEPGIQDSTGNESKERDYDKT